MSAHDTTVETVGGWGVSVTTTTTVVVDVGLGPAVGAGRHFGIPSIKIHSPSVVVAAVEIVDGVETAVVTVVVEDSVVVGDNGDDGGGGSDGLKGVLAAEIVDEVIRSHVKFVDLSDRVTGQPQENVN
jgi:hypothetical protein